MHWSAPGSCIIDPVVGTSDLQYRMIPGVGKPATDPGKPQRRFQERFTETVAIFIEKAPDTVLDKRNGPEISFTMIEPCPENIIDTYGD
jgi:hypothetical protein